MKSIIDQRARKPVMTRKRGSNYDVTDAIFNILLSGKIIDTETSFLFFLLRLHGQILENDQPYIKYRLKLISYQRGSIY